MKQVSGSERNIFEGTVALQVFIGFPNNKRRADKGKVQVDADKPMLHLSKDLFESKAYKRFLNQVGEIRQICRVRWAVPASILSRGGVYVVPIDAIEKIIAELDDAFAKLEALKEEFLGEYPTLKEEARGRLRALYKASDYPEVSELREAFRFEYNILEFGTPQRMASINAEIFKKEKEKMRRRMAEAEAMAWTAMREQFKELVDHMVDRLTPEKDGKPKIFRNSMIGNFQSFLETFNFRNISNDKELAKEVAKARKLLNGIAPDELRKNEAVRDSIQNGFTSMKEQLEVMVTVKPRRRIRLSEKTD